MGKKAKTQTFFYQFLRKILIKREMSGNSDDRRGGGLAGKNGEVRVTTGGKQADSGGVRDVFIGNLSLFTDNDKLRAYFEDRFGKGTVEDVRIMFHPETKRSRRFGFVTFRDATVTAAVMSETHKLDRKTIDIKFAHGSNRGDKTSGSHLVTKVFVGGVSQDTTDDDFKTYFAQFGTVESFNLLKDEVNGRNRGFGFVTFQLENSVDHACSIRFHMLKGKKVEVKRANPKGQAIHRQYGKRLDGLLPSPRSELKRGLSLRYNPYIGGMPMQNAMHPNTSALSHANHHAPALMGGAPALMTPVPPGFPALTDFQAASIQAALLNYFSAQPSQHALGGTQGSEGTTPLYPPVCQQTANNSVQQQQPQSGYGYQTNNYQQPPPNYNK